MTVNATRRYSINVMRPMFALAIICAPALAAAQSATTVTIAKPVVASTPKPFARLSASVHSLRDSIVALTRSQLGVKYRRGASSPDNGFDCSGLVKYVLAHFGAELPRTSNEQALVGQRIERNVAALRPGDLLTFGHGKRVSHIGIYIGEGKFVHAPHAGTRVRVESLANTKGSWWKGARRLFSSDDSTALALVN